MNAIRDIAWRLRTEAGARNFRHSPGRVSFRLRNLSPVNGINYVSVIESGDTLTIRFYRRVKKRTTLVGCACIHPENLVQTFTQTTGYELTPL